MHLVQLSGFSIEEVSLKVYCRVEQCSAVQMTNVDKMSVAEGGKWICNISHNYTTHNTPTLTYQGEREGEAEVKVEEEVSGKGYEGNIN